MKRRLLLSFVLFLTLSAQDTPALAIASPAPGEVLRGQVTVTGTLAAPGFTLAQLEFAYADNPTDTWFSIQVFSEPIVDSTLALWDTTSITDGEYVLRLRASLEDGTLQEVTVPIQIGNDLPVPSPTVEPTATPQENLIQVPTPFLLAASPTPTELPRPTPTMLPANPVSLEPNEIYQSLGRGALVILGLFALAGLILRARRY